jgi:hypothetical protein
MVHKVHIDTPIIDENTKINTNFMDTYNYRNYGQMIEFIHKNIEYHGYIIDFPLSFINKLRYLYYTRTYNNYGIRFGSSSKELTLIYCVKPIKIYKDGNWIPFESSKKIIIHHYQIKKVF